MFSQGENLEGI